MEIPYQLFGKQQLFEILCRYLWEKLNFTSTPFVARMHTMRKEYSLQSLKTIRLVFQLLWNYFYYR